ncbi:MAG: hypothetical protein ABSE56_03285 [Bryobacteraceae bacterium]|jgi:hypothetical protein
MIMVSSFDAALTVSQAAAFFLSPEGPLHRQYEALRTGTRPAELICDSQLTTHENLSRLNRQGIGFITLRRRSGKMLADIYSRPASAWQRITLDSLTPTFCTPRLSDEHVALQGEGGDIHACAVQACMRTASRGKGAIESRNSPCEVTWPNMVNHSSPAKKNVDANKSRCC